MLLSHRVAPSRLNQGNWEPHRAACVSLMPQCLSPLAPGLLPRGGLIHTQSLTRETVRPAFPHERQVHVHLQIRRQSGPECSSGGSPQHYSNWPQCFIQTLFSSSRVILNSARSAHIRLTAEWNSAAQHLSTSAPLLHPCHCLQSLVAASLPEIRNHPPNYLQCV